MSAGVGAVSTAFLRAIWQGHSMEVIGFELYRDTVVSVWACTVCARTMSVSTVEVYVRGDALAEGCSSAVVEDGSVAGGGDT